MVWNNKEKRRFTRAIFPCKLAVGSPLHWLSSHTEDISAGGIRVILDEGLKLPSTVNLEISFEKNKTIRCKGRAVWIQKKINPIAVDKEPIAFVTGIEFTEIKDCDREYIKNMVSALSI
jgi:c-di-GMP-binding flagellar brake protein YcgR